MGRNRPKQQAIRECGSLDCENWRALAGFACGIWRVEQHAPPLHPLAQRGSLGTAAGGVHRRTGHGVAHGGCHPCPIPSACGWGCRGQRGREPHKRGRNSKIHLAVDSFGLPVRVAVTAGTVADCTQAFPLVEGLKAAAFLADRGYDTDAIVEGVQKAGMEAVIPSRANRKVARAYDKYPNKLRHLAENAFLHMKAWRGMATRYAKRLSSFLAFARLRCAFMWLKAIS